MTPKRSTESSPNAGRPAPAGPAEGAAVPGPPPARQRDEAAARERRPPRRNARPAGKPAPSPRGPRASGPVREAAPARRAAFAVLLRIENAARRRGPSPHPDALIARLVDRRGNPPAENDRALARELVFGVLRHRRGLDYALRAYCRRPLSRLEPRVRVALRLGLYGLRHQDRVPSRAAVHDSVALVAAGDRPGAGGMVNAVLRSYLRADHPWPHAGGDPALYLRAGLSHPDWLVDRAVARWGLEGAKKALEANNRSPAGFLRVRRRFDLEEVREALREGGVETVPSPLAPRCLRIVRGNPTGSAPFRDGAIHLQDAGSQLIGWLLPEGGRALDLAAAPGGKATILAERWAPKRVFAADLRPPRVRLLAETAARLEADNLLPLAADAGRPPFPAGSFDRVLLDAPCTGLGTLARNPDIKWTATPKRLAALAKTQRRLAAAAARLVAPGGLLLYSVCSLEPEETVEIVADLREQDPSLHPADLAAQLPEPLHPLLDPDGALHLPPGAHDTDGYYAALLRRHRV